MIRGTMIRDARELISPSLLITIYVGIMPPENHMVSRIIRE